MTVTKNDLMETQTQITLWQPFAQLIHGGAFLVNIDTAHVFNFYQRQNPSADTDQWQHVVYLKAGIYDLWMYHQKGPAAGKLDITCHSLTDTDITQTTDFYNATLQRNQISGISFTVQRDGQHWIDGRVNGKNAPSGGYDCFLTMMSLIHR